MERKPSDLMMENERIIETNVWFTEMNGAVENKPARSFEVEKANLSDERSVCLWQGDHMKRLRGKFFAKMVMVLAFSKRLIEVKIERKPSIVFGNSGRIMERPISRLIRVLQL